MRVMVLVAAAVLATCAALTGCGGHKQFSLEATAWQLVSLQSMDDTQGTTTVPDPSKFTVEFSHDGQAFFQLDCNRGKGTWKSEPSSDSQSGSVTFGPIATTMMACPPPSLDQTVAKAFGEVRGYLVKDDQLHLTRLADGGILTWRRGEPRNQ